MMESSAPPLDAMPGIGVIIVTHQSAAYVAQCLEALLATEYRKLTAIVVDNASKDDTCDEVRSWASGDKVFQAPANWPLASAKPVAKPIRFAEQGLEKELGEIDANARVTLLRSPCNFGFAGGVNLGIRALLPINDIDYFWILSPRCVTYRNTPFAFARHAREIHNFAIMGGRMVAFDDPNRIRADGGVYNPRLGLTRLVNLNERSGKRSLPNPKELDYIPGDNMLVSRAFVLSAGLLDESWFLYREEVDWAFRRGSLPLAVAPGALVAHRAGTWSNGRDVRSPESAFLYYRNYLRFSARWSPSFLPLSYAAAILNIASDFFANGLRKPELAAALRGLHGLRPPPDVERFFDHRTWAIIRSRRKDSSASCLWPRASEKRRSQRGRHYKTYRFLKSVFDPRSYLHLLKLINYYNYNHVTQRRVAWLGKNCAFAPNVMFSHAERICIGENTKVGPGCYLWAGHEFGHIFIGKNVLLGPEVMVTAATYRFRDGSPVWDQRMDEDDVVIGDDVWIGTRAIILPGARIGDGAIIGAGSIVRGEIPARSVAVGAPASVKGKR
ncbi:MAG TPA: glycosyltransferase [Verrucomicrobiota bacterium]|nr:hypothetical protein [Verrucomicrobiales bacterium]HRI13203.1 glycosyltransferase [Verrucomicrobiota bacterium]